MTRIPPDDMITVVIYVRKTAAKWRIQRLSGMNITKVYIYGNEADRYIFRECLREDVTFAGFIDAADCSADTSSPDAGFIVHGEEEANEMISLGADPARIVQFWDKRVFRDGSVRAAIKEVMRPFSWLKWFVRIPLEKKAADGGRSKEALKRIAARDRSFVEKYHSDKKLVLAGDPETVGAYAEKCGDLVWGMIGDDAGTAGKDGSPHRTMDDLLSEDPNGFLYVLLGGRGLRKTEGTLMEMGAEPERIFWNGIRTSKKTYAGIKAQNAIDPLIGYSRADGPAPGFVVFGEERADTSLRVVTLGGSTSDPTFENLKSWSEYLYESLEKLMPGRVVLYAGGEGAFVCAQECLKLMKDVIPLEPDIVISYSGVNDTGRIGYSQPGHPFVRSYMPSVFESGIEKKELKNRFNGNIPIVRVTSGIKDEATAAGFWLRCERLMHAMCGEYGIPFHGFLQPYSKRGAQRYSIEKQRMTEAFYEEAAAGLAELPWLHDLTGIFDRDPSVFFDICHVYEKGNRMIARAVMPYILESTGGHER